MSTWPRSTTTASPKLHSSVKSILKLTFFIIFFSDAYVTLATNDYYSLGALTLAASLERHGSRKERVVMITEKVSEKMRWG